MCVCVCVCVFACLLYVIMCARSVGAWVQKQCVLIVLASLLSHDKPLRLRFLFMNVHISSSKHKTAAFLSSFFSSSCFFFVYEIPSPAFFNLPASPFSRSSFFIPLSVSWVLISIVHISLLYQSSQGICISNEKSTSLTCKLMDVNYAFIAGC